MKTETAAEKNASVQQAYPKGRWSVNANPFKTARRVPASPVQSAPGVQQGELSLEKVRPVRNDLSDTDLELIPAKQPQENVFAAPAAGAAAPKLSLWGRIKARFSRRGK